MKPYEDMAADSNLVWEETPMDGVAKCGVAQPLPCY